MMLLLQGILIGIVFGVPAGAIGALALQRAFEYGFKAGIVTGLGSTIADIIYAFVGVLGITIVQNFIQRWQLPICIVGGIMIISMGIITLKKKRNIKMTKEECMKYYMMFLSSLAIALCNPATIFSFIAVFAMLHIKVGRDIVSGTSFVIGIGIGTCIWWIVISGLASFLKEKASEKIYARLYKIMGILLMFFGAMIILNGIR